MASADLQKFLDELRARISIVDVVGAKVKLVRKGREYQACCPFHNEKTPSFTVNEAKGFYHCFGCGAHGDIIKFEMEANNLAFLDAVHKLADKAGLRVPQDISVAGYDGIALGQYSIPRLTTIRQDMEQLAQRSAKILLHCIEEPGRAVHEVVPFDLIEGESVGKV